MKYEKGLTIILPCYVNLGSFLHNVEKIADADLFVTSIESSNLAQGGAILLKGNMKLVNALKSSKFTRE